MMQGKVGNGQFGYTLASADLDHDGFSGESSKLIDLLRNNDLRFHLSS